MRFDRRYTGRWLSGLLMLLLLLTGCSSDEEQREKARLKIYVFAPDRPIVTRADNGDVSASEAEKKINSLHVWVFEHETGKYVGHISLSNVTLSETTGSAITMELDDAFADRETKPNVDVYVAANVTSANCGVSLNAATTRDQLEAALIGQNYFGLSPLIFSISSAVYIPFGIA